METLTRRSFLKLAGMFGAGALLPWRDKFEGAPDVDLPLVLPDGIDGLPLPSQVPDIAVKTHTQTAEIAWTRVLLWLDGEPVRGVYSAILKSSVDRIGPCWDECGGAHYFAGHSASSLSCEWLGKREDWVRLHSMLKVGEGGVDIAIAMPGSDRLTRWRALGSKYTARKVRHSFRKPPAGSHLMAPEAELLHVDIVFVGDDPVMQADFSEGMKALLAEG